MGLVSRAAKEFWPVILLLVCHATLGLSAVHQKSMTFDEGVHMTGGYSYWALNDYRLQPENGNWSQRFAGIPAWLAGHSFPTNDNPAWRDANVWVLCDQLIFAPDTDADALVWRSRIMMALPGAILGMLVYLWSRRLFGPWGGLLSLAVYAFSPTMLANGFLTTSDLFATLFFLAAVWALWTMLHAVSLRTFALSALAIAGLLLSKFSSVAIAPIALALMGIRLLNPQPLSISLGPRRQICGRLRQLVLLATIVTLQVPCVAAIVWASYGFRYSSFAPAHTKGAHLQAPWDLLQKKAPAISNTLVRFARDYHLLPEAYVQGFAFISYSTNQRNSFLNGKFSRQGFVTYFPYCLAVKTPISLFVLLAIAGWGSWTYRGISEDVNPRGQAVRWPRLYAASPLLTLVAVYWAFALASNLNIGHRHLLPTYPPLFILAGAAVLWFAAPSLQMVPVNKNGGKATGRRPPRATVVLAARLSIASALVMMSAGSIWIWPDYLTYFNLFAGGPRYGYRHLVDSSLDWGQDLQGLQRWLDDHHEDVGDRRRVYFSYFGAASPDYYHIGGQPLPGYEPRWAAHVPRPLTGGLYCVSATMLQSVYLTFPGRWNAEYEKMYQALRAALEPVIQPGADLSTLERHATNVTPEELQTAFRHYEDLRFGRLCSFLRTREPDDEVGHSILIYRLTDADVAGALGGKPPELLPAPEFQERAES